MKTIHVFINLSLCRFTMQICEDHTAIELVKFRNGENNAAIYFFFFLSILAVDQSTKKVWFIPHITLASFLHFMARIRDMIFPSVSWTMEPQHMSLMYKQKGGFTRRQTR